MAFADHLLWADMVDHEPPAPLTPPTRDAATQTDEVLIFPQILPDAHLAILGSRRRPVLPTRLLVQVRAFLGYLLQLCMRPQHTGPFRLARGARRSSSRRFFCEPRSSAFGGRATLRSFRHSFSPGRLDRSRTHTRTIARCASRRVRSNSRSAGTSLALSLVPTFRSPLELRGATSWKLSSKKKEIAPGPRQGFVEYSPQTLKLLLRRKRGSL